MERESHGAKPVIFTVVVGLLASGFSLPFTETISGSGAIFVRHNSSLAWRCETWL